MGKLTRLEELYIDTNHLEYLPHQICDLLYLECLDVSENKLMALPDDLGNMQSLYDLTLSLNCLEVCAAPAPSCIFIFLTSEKMPCYLQKLPHSIGRLKKLAILKVDHNRLFELTSAIGSCHALQANSLF